MTRGVEEIEHSIIDCILELFFGLVMPVVHFVTGTRNAVDHSEVIRSRKTSILPRAGRYVAAHPLSCFTLCQGRHCRMSCQSGQVVDTENHSSSSPPLPFTFRAVNPLSEFSIPMLSLHCHPAPSFSLSQVAVASHAACRDQAKSAGFHGP